MLERINRYGAATQLGQTLASFGVAAVRELAQDCDARYGELLGELNARDKSGQPMPSGLYDRLFDVSAQTQTRARGSRASRVAISRGSKHPPTPAPARCSASLIPGAGRVPATGGRVEWLRMDS